MTTLVPLNELFVRKQFRVPDYQRGYAWEEVHRNDLLQDLEGLERLREGRKHFMGTLVLHKQGEFQTEKTGRTFERVDIVDGQQRLTTLVILLNEIAHLLDGCDTQLAEHAAREIRQDYVEYASPGERIRRLHLFGSADQFFENAVLGEGASRTPEVPAEERLKEAQQEFSDYLSDRRESGTGEEGGRSGQSYLMNLRRSITEDLGFVVYEVDSQAEVGVMFEVMNARGKSLSQLEKVKNYLLYATSKLESEEEVKRLSERINETWRKLLRTFQRFDESDEEQFLKYHWVVYPHAPEDENPNNVSDIHRALKETIDLRTLSDADISRGVDRYSRSLAENRHIYRALVLAESEAFSRLDQTAEAAARHVAAINRIDRPATVRPLAMALIRQFADAPERLVELLRLLEVFCFRTAAMEYYSNKGRSRLYSLARDIAKGKVTGYEAIRGDIAGAITDICPDARVRKSLGDPDRNFYDWSQLRFFLYEYERHLEQKQGVGRAPEWHEVERRELNQTIEHILPQGKNTLDVDYWGSRFSDEEWRAYHHRLGNLCLTDWNSNYGNRGFDEKCRPKSEDPNEPAYRNSAWHQERELVNVEAWTPNAIEERHERLVEFALARWSV